MKFIKITFFTLISALLGFVVGYILFARYGDEYIPLKSIFAGTLLEDAILNGILNLKLKLSGTAGAFGFAGLIVAILLEQKSKSVSNSGFYQCPHCDFKYHEPFYFCPACEYDITGHSRNDYHRKASEKLAEKRATTSGE
jgi:hypothetical protein